MPKYKLLVLQLCLFKIHGFMLLLKNCSTVFFHITTNSNITLKGNNIPLSTISFIQHTLIDHYYMPETVNSTGRYHSFAELSEWYYVPGPVLATGGI